MANNFDLIVIGSGPGGYVAAIRASQLGMKVACVERESLGGICLNWGCIPTKALLKSAEVFQYLQHAEDYGIKVDGFSPMFDKVVQRSRGVADGMSKGISFLFRKNKITTLEGFGKLTKDKKVEVTDKDGKRTVYAAKNIIVATGARARSLPHMAIDGKKIIGYREALVQPELPKSMIVVGSGAIGTEFAYFYNAMGTEVTLVEYMDRILPVEDAEVSRTAEKSFKKQGIKVMSSAEVTAVDTKGKGVTATVKTKKGEEKIKADMLLSAVGIVTNIENIGLEEAGVKPKKERSL